MMKAYAKLNLFLHVTGKREDGYHLLDSLMMPINIYDTVSVFEANGFHMVLGGEFASKVGNISKNIIYKTSRLLSIKTGHDNGSVGIKLQKNIPVGAGLGGGSTDSAATIRLLNDEWGLALGNKKLHEIGISIGADVPFCIDSCPAFISGVGENLDFVNPEIFKGLKILLVYPNIIMRTHKVFEAIRGNIFKKTIQRPQLNTQEQLIEFVMEQENDLTKAAIAILPVIDDILSVIKSKRGCHLARMTGSGSTCFGIFEDDDSLEAARKAIEECYTSWWVRVVSVN